VSGWILDGLRLAVALAVMTLWRVSLSLWMFACCLSWPRGLCAQQPPAAAPAASSSGPVTAAQVADDEDEGVLDPAEPDFIVVNLPTSMRLPTHRGNFRLTHRFAGNLRNGTFGELAGNLFGLDQGAIIGFEYRFAPIRQIQTAVYRSSFDKTFQFYGKYDARQQRGRLPLSISALVSIEGTNNFQDKYAPSVGLVISRRLAGRLAGYVTPMFVGNSAASLDAIAHQHGADETAADLDEPPVHQHTIYVGLAARARVYGTLYLVGEMAPRVDGYAPDDMEYGFGLEKRVGGHTFSLTFTNTFGTTFAQLARGGTANSLYLGFNLARKFF
jgi:Membrane bound beta barrel domain (DUF5777)